MSTNRHSYVNFTKTPYICKYGVALDATDYYAPQNNFNSNFNSNFNYDNRTIVRTNLANNCIINRVPTNGMANIKIPNTQTLQNY